jgi:predicted transcriptional regulator
LAVRRESPIGRGGYTYEYEAVPPEIVRDKVRGILDEWYSKVKRDLESLPSEIMERKETAKQG